MPSKNHLLFAWILTLSPITSAASTRTQIIVSASGSGEYRTVQEAVDHANGATMIVIRPGIYHEKILIRRDDIWLVGTGREPKDVLITYGDSSKNTGSTFKSGTVTVDADRFAAENLTIVNTWWDEHHDPADASQAVALQLTSDRAVVDHVRLISGQDTLFTGSRTCRSATDTEPCEASRQYFHDCYIEGNVDYIFGDAKAVFEGCELHSRPHHTVMVTAQSKHTPTEDSGYYFLDCKITGANNGDVIVLGRPWRDYATVLFVHTDIEQALAPQGWSDWDGRLKTATYREYGSFGPGVNGGHRSVMSPPLTAEEKSKLNTKSLLAGADRWDPVSELVQMLSQARLHQ
jgi:pectinesterase